MIESTVPSGEPATSGRASGRGDWQDSPEANLEALMNTPLDLSPATAFTLVPPSEEITFHQQLDEAEEMSTVISLCREILQLSMNRKLQIRQLNDHIKIGESLHRQQVEHLTKLAVDLKDQLIKARMK